MKPINPLLIQFAGGKCIIIVVLSISYIELFLMTKTETLWTGAFASRKQLVMIAPSLPRLLHCHRRRYETHVVKRCLHCRAPGGAYIFRVDTTAGESMGARLDILVPCGEQCRRVGMQRKKYGLLTLFVVVLGAARLEARARARADGPMNP
jgi:hypothetical protein